VPPRLEQTVIWAESIQITVDGDLDRAGIGALRRLLADAVGSGPPCVVLDLSTCGYLEAGGLGVIVELERRLAANGQELVVDGAAGQVERLIASAGAISPRARLPQLR
jgi:anti-anti-sigma factor